MGNLHELIDTLSADQHDDFLGYLSRTLPFHQLESITRDPEPRFKALTSAEFAVATYRRDWLINRVLVKGQFAVVGGAKKTLKTSTLIEMVLSLAGAGDFLGYFSVPRPVRVAIFSGESGEATIQETARRIAQSRGIDFAATDARWLFDLPQLASESDLRELRTFIADNKIEVAIVDPLYLCLSGDKVEHTNLYSTGPFLRGFAKSCLDYGCTPILAHHSKKLGNREELLPIDLDDLAFAGIAEIARQWVLLSRRSLYQEGTGRHELWLKIGGSAGHSGLYEMDVDEGVIDDGFAGRTWSVDVRRSGGVAETRKKDQDAKISREAERVLSALQAAGEPLSRDEVMAKAGLSERKTGVALKTLLADNRIVEAGSRKGKRGKAPMTYWLQSDRAD